MFSDLTRDGWLLFVTRTVRLFSYGWLSVALILYLEAIGMSQFEIGVLFSGTLFGDLVVTFYLTTTADSWGRKNILLISAILKLFAGVVYALFSNFYALLFAGVVGVISPAGGEIGPFLAVEQAAITNTLKNKDSLTNIIAWYNLIGYVALALGALSSGLWITFAHETLGYSLLAAYRTIVFGYAFFGALKFFLYLACSTDIEPLHTRDPAAPRDWFSKFGLHHASSRLIVAKLSALFILDAFAGGFVMQSIIVYWFSKEWAMNADLLGSMMLGANLLAGVSALVAAPLERRIGAINTMVFTHLPSNVFLLLVPFMPTQNSAVTMLLIRFSISQMDVPARQSYVQKVVQEDERSAAGGITNTVRSIGVALSPLLVGYLLEAQPTSVTFQLPFIIAGALKIAYDLLLYISFQLTEKKQEVQKYERVQHEEDDEEEQDGENGALHQKESTFPVAKPVN